MSEKTKLRDALEELVLDIGQLSIRLEPLITGYTETAPSIMDKTTFRKARKTTMKDAKSIAHHMRLRIQELTEQAEEVLYNK